MYENVLGHDSKALADPNYQDWLRRGVIWAATGDSRWIVAFGRQRSPHASHRVDEQLTTDD